MITLDNIQFVTVTELAAHSGYSASHLREMSRVKDSRGAVKLPRVCVKQIGGGIAYMYDLRKCLSLLEGAPKSRRRGRRKPVEQNACETQWQARLLAGL